MSYTGFKAKNEREYNAASAYLRSLGLNKRSSLGRRFSAERSAVVFISNDNTTFDIADNGSSVAADIGTQSFGTFLDKHGADLMTPPVTVELNEDHKAVVHNDRVVVGCQTFTFDRVVALAEEVKKRQREQVQASPLPSLSVSDLGCGMGLPTSW